MIWGILFIGCLFLFVLVRFLTKPYATIGTTKHGTTAVTNVYWGTLAVLSVAYSLLAWKAYQATNPNIPNDSAEQAASTYLTWGRYLDSVVYIGLIPIALALWLCWANAPQGKKLLTLALVFLWFFVAVDFIYLAERYFHFKKSHDIWAGEFSLSGLVGIIWAILVGIITLLLYSLLTQRRR
jgi:hypothetical protein